MLLECEANGCIRANIRIDAIKKRKEILMANPDSIEGSRRDSGAPCVYAFPGKPLAPIAGKPMIQHVVERVRQARLGSRIVVATDEDAIKKAVEAFGGEAMLTRHDHRTGTDRVAEVAAHVAAEIYVNVQGDEPLIDPGTVDALVAAMLEDSAFRSPLRAPRSRSRTTSWTPMS